MRKAFTLVELLVTISIIGILAALGLVSFTGAQKQARDTQRKSDLKQYQLALESYANTHNGLYPPTNSHQEASTWLCGVLALTNCPQDPKYDESRIWYAYMTPTSTGATSYVLWTVLENGTDVKWAVCSSGKSGIAPYHPFDGVCPL